MKKSDNDSNAPSDRRFGLNKPKPWERAPKKRYILRVYEEKEAKEEIQQYEDSETGSDVVRLDGLGLDSRERSQGELP